MGRLIIVCALIVSAVLLALELYVINERQKTPPFYRIPPGPGTIERDTPFRNNPLVIPLTQPSPSATRPTTKP